MSPALRAGRPGFWLAGLGLALLASGLYAWLNLRPFTQLLEQSTSTAARLTLVSCQDPATVRYAFEAKNRTWFGSASPDAFGIPCEDLRAGAQVPLVYVSSDPSISAGLAGLEERQRDGRLGTGLCFAAVLAGTLALLWLMSPRGVLASGRGQ